MPGPCPLLPGGRRAGGEGQVTAIETREAIVNQVGTGARPAALSADIVEARSKERGEPGWLTQQRRAASEQAGELPVPTRTTEGWRRTDLSDLDLNVLLAGQGAAATTDGVRGEDLGALAGALRLVDG